MAANGGALDGTRVFDPRTIRRATSEQSYYEIDFTLEENSGNVLREIEAALKRLDDGTYGICTACGKPIEPERLEYLPWATQCADDARGGRG